MLLFYLLLHDSDSIYFQHKEFEEIEGRVHRREPLISGSSTAQKLSRRLAVEVISDPLNDMENDPYEDGSDVRKEHRARQVYFTLAITQKVFLGLHLDSKRQAR